MEEKKFFDDLDKGWNLSSRARTITETDIVLFAAFTGDWAPHHTDAEFAKTLPFKGRIAHGMLVISVASGLIDYACEIAVIAFGGMDRVRFVAPVMIDDTIHVETELIEKEDKNDKSGNLIFNQLTINQKGETVATARLKLLVMKKPGK